MPEVVDSLPEGFSFASPSPAPPQVVDSLPDGFSFAPEGAAPPKEAGLLDTISSYLGKGREAVQHAIGLSGQNVYSYLNEHGIPGVAAPGSLYNTALSRLGSTAYDLGTDPLTYAPFGAMAKFGQAGKLAMGAASAAFTALQAKGLYDAGKQLNTELNKALDNGTLTPELMNSLVQTAVAGAGVALGAHGTYEGIKGGMAPGETPPPSGAGPSEAVRAAISPEDAALLQRISDAKAAGLEPIPYKPDVTQPPPSGKPAKVARGPYTAVDDIVAQIQQEQAAQGAPAEPSMVRDPNTVGEYGGARPNATAENVTSLRPEDIAAINKIVEQLPQQEAAPTPEAAPESYVAPPEALKGTAFEDRPLPQAPIEPTPEGMQQVLMGQEGPQYTPPEEAPPTEQAPPAEGAPPAAAPPQSLESKQQPILDQLSQMGVDMAAGKRQGPKAPEAPAEPAGPPSIFDSEGKLAPGDPEAGVLMLQKGSLLPLARQAARSIGNVLEEIIGLSKAIPTSLDVSAPLRQGIGLLGHAPIEFGKAFKDQFTWMRHPEAYKAMVESVHADSLDLGERTGVGGDFYKKIDLAVTAGEQGRPRSQREDAFRSKWAEKIPGVAASERAYSGFLTKMRSVVIKPEVEAMIKEGLSPEEILDRSKEIARTINILSGRGTLSPELASVGNKFLYSARFRAAKFQQFSDVLFRPQPMRAKVMMVQGKLGHYVTALGMVALAKQSGWTVDLDPRSPDFLKARKGKIRLDLGAGDIQTLRLLWRMKNEQKKYLSGDIVRVTPLQSLGEYGLNAMAPVPAAITRSLMPDTDEAKNKELIRQADSVFPMFKRTFQDVVAQDVSLLEKATVLGLSQAGAGVDVYDEPKNLTADEKAAYESKYQSEKQAADIRSRTPIPRGEPKKPEDQAKAAQKSLKKVTYTEEIYKALQSGDIPAAYQAKLRAEDDGISIDVEELQSRLKAQQDEAALRERPSL